MKTFRIFVVSLFLVGICSVSAFAQAASPKVALVNTNDFYMEEGGITKILNAYQKLEVEFKTATGELETMQKRGEALGAEIKAMQENKAVPFNETQYRTKVGELERLDIDFKRKKEDLEKAVGKREGDLLGPVIKDIGDKLGAFAKQKGFDLVLDGGKLYQGQILLYFNDSIDLTKAFITYYNALPAGTASVQ